MNIAPFSQELSPESIQTPLAAQESSNRDESAAHSTRKIPQVNPRAPSSISLKTLAPKPHI